MQQLYQFASGPLAWAAFIIFFFGLGCRLVAMFRQISKKEPFLYEYWSWDHALNSILRWWIIPFGARNARLNPVMTIVTWLFHVCLIFAPLLLVAHVVVLDESVLGWSWPTLPEAVTDVMAIIVVLGGCYFAWRRLTLPQVKYVTSGSDFIILAIVVAPFLTGILAYHQLGDPLTWTTLHILTGELWLAAIPFTRLVHMLYAPFVRGYTGSEFQGIRHVKDY